MLHEPAFRESREREVASSNRVITGDRFHTVPPSWPPTKQGKLLDFVRIGQAVAGVVFCVLGGVESASRLVIAPVFEPDPQSPGSTASGCANEAGHTRSPLIAGWHRSSPGTAQFHPGSR